VDPKITVVTPAYNHARFIAWAVRSVFLQRYPNLEYILMDGGSTDKTMEVLEPYRSRFAHLISEKDRGQSEAIRKGFDLSTGEILAYLNSDDMLAPGALHFVARFFRANPEVDAVYSHRCTVDTDNRVTGYWVLPPHSNYLMSRWALIPQETCFWRRRLLEKCGNINEAYRFAMDYELFVRYMKGGRFKRVNRFLAAFRHHEQSKTCMLMSTVGEKEIQEVRQCYGITLSGPEQILGGLFASGVRLAGTLYASACRMSPGNLRGIGHKYDELWGGLAG
jgi:glycosyltransferase involved in cell wall biosynthesis